MSENTSKLDYRDPDWVAEQLGIDKNTVYKYLQDGALPGLQLGRKWLVSERRLAEFLERVEREQTQRRQATLAKPQPFVLPPRRRMLEENGPE
jgi:excisionase family DNA binding protein